MTESDTRPVFDRDGMLDRLGGDDELLVEIVALFRSESVPMLAEVRTAVAAGDVARTRSSAHAIKGALLNVGAAAAAEAAGRVEWAAIAGDPDAAAAAFRELDDELARLDGVLTCA